MAIDFSAASEQFLYLAAASAPYASFTDNLSVSFWAKRNTAIGSDLWYIIGFDNATDGDQNWRLALQGRGGGNMRLSFRYWRSGGTIGTIVSSEFAEPTAWTHYGMTMKSGADNARFFKDGSLVSSSSGINATIDTDTCGCAIGALVGSDLTPTANDSLWVDAELAELGAWNVTLTDADMATLGDGVAPVYLRDGLVIYLPMRNASDLLDPATGETFTAYNTPTDADHPGIFYPHSARVVPTATAAAAGGFFAGRYYHEHVAGASR